MSFDATAPLTTVAGLTCWRLNSRSTVPPSGWRCGSTILRRIQISEFVAVMFPPSSYPANFDALRTDFAVSAPLVLKSDMRDERLPGTPCSRDVADRCLDK